MPSAGTTSSTCSVLVRKPNPTKTPASAIQRTEPLSIAWRVAHAASAMRRVRRASGLLKRNMRTATGVSASAAPARRPAAAPKRRFTVAWTTATVPTPIRTWGSRIAKELSPKRRTDRAMAHSAAGGLSTVMALLASKLPQKNADHESAAGLDRGAVERVRPPAGRQVPEVGAARHDEEGDERRARPGRVALRSADQAPGPLPRGPSARFVDGLPRRRHGSGGGVGGRRSGRRVGRGQGRGVHASTVGLPAVRVLWHRCRPPQTCSSPRRECGNGRSDNHFRTHGGGGGRMRRCRRPSAPVPEGRAPLARPAGPPRRARHRRRPHRRRVRRGRRDPGRRGLPRLPPRRRAPRPRGRGVGRARRRAGRRHRDLRRAGVGPRRGVARGRGRDALARRRPGGDGPRHRRDAGPPRHRPGSRTRGLGAMVLSSSTTMHAAHRLYERLGFTRLPDRDWSPVPEVRLLAYTLPLTD